LQWRKTVLVFFRGNQQEIRVKRTHLIGGQKNTFFREHRKNLGKDFNRVCQKKKPVVWDQEKEGGTPAEKMPRF